MSSTRHKVITLANSGYINGESSYILKHSGTDRITINGDGVGISTSSNINNNLQINGTVGIGYTVSAPSNGLIISGNVGIGKTDPAYKLHVEGDINIPSGSNFKINGVNISGGSSQWTTNGSDIYYNTGNVGIGITNPISKVTINPIVVDRNSFDHSISPLTITQPTATSSSVLNDSQPVLHLTRQGTDGQSFGARATFSLSRYENDSSNSRTRLDLQLSHGSYDTVNLLTGLSNGNIGINTSSNINNNLQVNGNVSVGYTTSAPSNGLIVSGSVGIGTDNPISALQITGGSLTCDSSIVANGGINLSNGFVISDTSDITVNTNTFVVKGTTGNVGIGTANPITKLHVNSGNIYAPGTIVQIQSYTYNGNATTNDSTWKQIDTNFKIAITPKSTSSKILIIGMLHIGGEESSDGRFTFIRLNRNLNSSDTYIGNGSNANTSNTGTECIAAGNWGAGVNGTTSFDLQVANVFINYIDTPATTNEITYSFYWNSNPGGAGSRKAWMNRSNNHGDGFRPNTISTITVYEIGG